MMINDELNPLQLIRDYIKDLKSDHNDFSKEYHSEILKVWQEIVRIQEKIEAMREEQKKQAKMWGLIGGAIPAAVTLTVSFLVNWLLKNQPGVGP